jgi:hypothetical protein
LLPSLRGMTISIMLAPVRLHDLHRVGRGCCGERCRKAVGILVCFLLLEIQLVEGSIVTIIVVIIIIVVVVVVVVVVVIIVIVVTIVTTGCL